MYKSRAQITGHAIDLLLFVWKPLRCKRRPFQSSAQHHVVQERRILLPCFIFFIYDLLVHLLLFPLLFYRHYEVISQLSMFTSDWDEWPTPKFKTSSILHRAGNLAAFSVLGLVLSRSGLRDSRDCDTCD